MSLEYQIDDDDDDDDDSDAPYPAPYELGYPVSDEIIPAETVTPLPDNPANMSISVLNAPASAASLYETHATNRDSYWLPLYKIFNTFNVVQRDIRKNVLYANVLKYAVMNLHKTNKIHLFGFNAASSLSKLQIDVNEHILTPSRGRFIIDNGPDRIIMEIEVFSNGDHLFSFFGTSYELVNKYVKLIEDESNTNNFYRNKVFNQEGEFIDVKCLTIDDVILSDRIYNDLKTNVIDFLSHTRHILARHNLPTKRGLIFAGPPGTGKSFSAKVLASTLKTSFIMVNNLPSTDEIHDIYQFIRKITPAVILFEDLDIYLGQRDFKLSALLNEIDGMEENKDLITILTTNRLEILDTAIKNRPGRFDRILYFNEPDEKLISHMLKLFSKSTNTSDVNFETLSKEFARKKYTGAHLKEMVITACMESAGGITDLETPIKLTTDSILNAAEKITNLLNTEKKIGLK